MTDTLFEKYTDAEIAQVNNLILSQLDSPVDLVNQVCGHLIISGGKRVRPRISLLVAKLLGSDKDPSITAFAASIEILHTATLMHDDVIDNSALRRGQKSVNEEYGNTLSVLGGDYLFTKAYNLILISKNFEVFKSLSDTIATLVQGEIEQMANIADTKITEETYMRTIYEKTSILFEIASKIPAILLNKDSATVLALKDFGIHLGNAFQITDDILDYISDSETIGKNIGDDLAENKITLPLIYTLNSPKANYDEICLAIQNKDIDKILKYISETNAIDSCIQKATSEIQLAIEALSIFPEDNVYRKALIELSQKILKRNK